MDINKLLKGVNCDCGRTHTCDIEYVYIENNAIQRLGEICGQDRNILLVADENTFAAAGEKTVFALAGKNIRKVIFSGGAILVPNETAIHEVRSALSDADLIVGIGSGVIQDLCKYVSFESKIPYIIVATAPSMDGYASNGAAMITGGMKVTYPAGLPVAIIADTEVIRNAPIEMLKAGYGDIIGKFSALNDWKLSHLINGEYFCPYIYDLTYAQIQKTLSLADGILKRDEESVKALMEALTIIGILMSFAGSSRPASGSEHHLSHYFEVLGLLKNEPYFCHGIDVAYSTYVTAQLRQELLAIDEPAAKAFDMAEWEANIRRVYSVPGNATAADGIIALQKKLGWINEDKLHVYRAKWAEIRQILSDSPTPEEILGMLTDVGLSMDDFYDMYSEEKLADAIRCAKDLKDRYTVLWLYEQVQ